MEKIPLKKRFSAFIKRKLSAVTVGSAKRPVLTTIGILVFVNLTVVFIAAAIALRLGEYQNFWFALVDAATWLVAPNAVLLQERFAMQVLNLIVLIFGLILFTGTVIAIITTAFRNYINQKGNAKGRLILSGHIVILNFNEKVIPILLDLTETKEDKTVLILSSEKREHILDTLQREQKPSEKGGKKKPKLKLLVRNGDPYSVKELGEISIENANSILIMKTKSCSDFSKAKLLTKLNSLKINDDCKVLIESENNKMDTTILKNKNIIPFSYEQKIIDLLALCALRPELVPVLSSLLSYYGPAIGFRKCTIEETLQKGQNSVPITSMVNTLSLCCPETGTRKRRVKGYKTSRRLTINNNFFKNAKLAENSKIKKVIALGSEKKLSEIEGCLQNIEFIKVSGEDELAEIVFENNFSHVAVLLLGDDEIKEETDARVFSAIFKLNNLLQGSERDFSLIVELQDSDNEGAIKEMGAKNIILSTRIASFLITKLLEDTSLAHFYEDMFTHTKNPRFSFTIKAIKAGSAFNFYKSSFLEFSTMREFIQASFLGSDGAICVLGRFNGEGLIDYFCFDIDKASLRLEENDTLLIVARL